MSQEKHNIQWFDGPEHYSAHLAHMPQEYRRMYDDHRSNWAGGNFEQALHKLNNGDTTNLAKAQAIVDKMANEQLFSMGQPVIESSLIGMAPNVPNALMGHPYEMYNIVESEQQSMLTPLRIFVETTVSAGLSNSELTNRGVAVMAFALAMSIVRPIELYAASFGHLESISHTKVYGTIVRIPTAPLDLERATYMLTGNGYCRKLAFTNMNWQAQITREQSIPFPRGRRDLCMCEPTDVLIQGGYLTDTLMLQNPIQWVKNMIAKHRGDVNEN